LLTIGDCRDCCNQLIGQWRALLSACFDADCGTQSQIELLAVEMTILRRSLSRFMDTADAMPHSTIPIDVKLCARNRELRERLLWARGELDKLESVEGGAPSRFSKEALRFVRDALIQLASRPWCFPRFFFQQLQQTQIKLNVSPQPSDMEMAVKVLISDRVAITVEGAVESDRLEKIHSIIVTARIRTISRTDGDHEQRVEVVDKHFKAQFLLSFSQSCTIEFGIELVEIETRRRWTSDARELLRIAVAGH